MYKKEQIEMLLVSGQAQYLLNVEHEKEQFPPIHMWYWQTKYSYISK